jgi:SET domain-containing protein
VYAREAIPANRKVIEYTGELISRREARHRSDQNPRVYLFALDSYWCKDGTSGGSGAEYINHSCNPNLRTVFMKGHILYFTRRPIRAGEELTVDYHLDRNVATVRCACGSENCRGTINVKD